MRVLVLLVRGGCAGGWWLVGGSAAESPKATILALPLVPALLGGLPPVVTAPRVAPPARRTGRAPLRLWLLRRGGPPEHRRRW